MSSTEQTFSLTDGTTVTVTDVTLSNGQRQLWVAQVGGQRLRGRFTSHVVNVTESGVTFAANAPRYVRSAVTGYLAA